MDIETKGTKKTSTGFANLLKDPKCGPKGGWRSKPVKGGGRALMIEFTRQLRKQGYRCEVNEIDCFFQIKWW